MMLRQNTGSSEFGNVSDAERRAKGGFRRQRAVIPNPQIGVGWVVSQFDFHRDMRGQSPLPHSGPKGAFAQWGLRIIWKAPSEEL
jgi:hypothetical protein